MSFLFIIIGIIGLYFGGDFLVRNSSTLAARLGVSPMVIGLTVVAFGTSTPELSATLISALNGAPELALGNVVGSNIANIGLILGLTALIYPLVTARQFLKREIPAALFVSLLLFPLLFNNIIGRLEGAGLLVLLGIYLWYLFQSDGAAEELEELEVEDSAPVWRLLGGIVLGIGFLVGGAQAMVTGAVSLAQQWGVPESVIGLTLVAFGTSLPELASSIVAAFKRQTDIILGNIIGSNIFNVLAVLGATAAVQPIQASLQSVRIDLWIMLALTVALFVLMLRGTRLGRRGGALLLSSYVAYILYAYL